MSSCYNICRRIDRREIADGRRYKSVESPLELFQAKMSLPEFSLEGKVYIVTGGGRGLGVALAGAIVEAGASKVYCIDLLPEPHEGWHQVKQNLKAKGDNLIFKSQDVTDEEGIQKVFDEIVKTEGRLDGLVCAAVLSQLMSLT